MLHLQSDVYCFWSVYWWVVKPGFLRSTIRQTEGTQIVQKSPAVEHRAGCVMWTLSSICCGCVVVVYPLPWPLLVGGVRCSRLWSTSQLLRPSGQQCSHSGGVCPQIQGRQCGAYVGAVEEMMCVVCVDVTEGA